MRRQGVTTQKQSPTFLMVVHLTSPDGKYDTLYLRNFARLHVKDALARLPGVGDAQIFGGGDYAMRAWLDPDKVASRGLTAGDVVGAMRSLAGMRLQEAQLALPAARRYAQSISTAIADVLQSAVTLAETKVPRREIGLQMRVDNGLPPIQGDHHQLCQLFTNLMINAFEALEGRGAVDVAALELRVRGAGHYTIGSAGHEGNVVLGRLTRVSDPSLVHYRSAALQLERARQVS